MSDNLVGEVRVKVRPDAHDFRKEANRDVDDALKGVRGEVPIDGKLRVDRNQVQRQIDMAREKLRGGDVKIVAKLETQIDKSYKEWGKAADDVKRQYDQLERQKKKWLGNNDKLNDPLRKAINQSAQEAGRLRKIYEDLEKSTSLMQARDNQRIADASEVRDLALEQEKKRLRELTAAQLKAEQKQAQNQQEFARLEQELQFRLQKRRSIASWDYQRKQAADNARIEAEQRRHAKEVWKIGDGTDFSLKGMPTDASQWVTADLIRARQQANKGMLDDANTMAASQEIYRRLSKLHNDELWEANKERAKANTDLLNQYRQKVDNANIEADFQKIRDEAKKTSDHIDQLDPQLKVEPVGLLAAAAQMQWASRPRTVPFYVTIDQKSYAIATGMLKSLAGVGVLSKSGQILEDMLVNFDKFAIKWGGIATAVGAIGNSFAWLGTAAVGVVSDLLSVTGLLAMVPTLIAGVGASVAIHTAAFEGMKKAIDGDNKELAKLPKNAQLAVKELRGLWKALQEPMQNNFWESMGTEAADTIKVLKPIFTDGLAEAASHVGAAWAHGARAMRDVAERGDLKQMFDNLSAGFDNAAESFYPLTDAMNRLGLRGSQFLPQFGTWIRQISEDFGEWVKQADEAGDINAWIAGAGVAMKDLGSVIKSTGSMFKSLATVAEDAGSEGLYGLRTSLESIADTMASEPWRSNMTTLLMGARRGASELNDGFLSLSRTVGDSSAAFSHMLDVLGRIGGGVLESIGSVIGQQKFQWGITSSLEGMAELLSELKPGFEDLGSILGTFGTLAGEVFRSLSGPINNILDLFEGITSDMEGNLLGLVPVLSDQLSLIINKLAGPIEFAFGAIDSLIGAFVGLGPVAQTAILTLAGLAAMRGPLGLLASTVGTKMHGAFSSLTNEVKKAPGVFDPVRLAWREQLRLVEKLNPATMGYATSVQHVGQGRAVLGHLATAYTHLNNAMAGWQKTSTGTVEATKHLRDGFVQAAAPLKPLADSAKTSMTAIRQELDPVRTGLHYLNQDLQKKGEEWRDRFKTMGTDVRDGMKAVPENFRNSLKDMPNYANHAAGTAVRDLKTAYRTMAFDAKLGAALISDATKAGLQPMGDTVRRAMDPAVAAAAKQWRTMSFDARYATAVMGDSIKEIARPLTTALTPATQAMTRQWTSAMDNMTRTTRTVGQSLGAALSPAVSQMQRHWNTMAFDARYANAVMTDAVTRNFQAIPGTIRASMAASMDDFRKFGSAMGTLGGHIQTSSAAMMTGFKNAGSAFGTNMGHLAGQLGQIGAAAGRAAGSVGGAAAGSLKWALGGLAGALGGGWGIAVMGGITAIMMMSAKAREAKNRVKELTNSLDEVTGQETANTYKTIATNWAQLGKEGQSAGKTAQALGLNLGDVTRAVSQGGASYDQMIGKLKAAQTGLVAYNATTDASSAAGAKFTGAGDDMQSSLQGIADSLNVPVERLQTMNESDLGNLIDNLEKTNAEVELAKAVWEGLAEATGSSVGGAQQMAAAMQVIGDMSVDAAGKIDAIKKSLDLLKGGKLSAQEAKIAAADAHQQAVDQALALRDQISANRGALFDSSTGMLSDQSTVARELFRVMEGSADGLLTAAQSAHDAAMIATNDPAQAMEAAMKVMGGSQSQLEDIAREAGITVPELQAQWDSFFGSEWELQATFTASAQKVQEAATAAKAMGLEFSSEEYMAWLMANGGPANVTAEQTTAYLRGKMNEQFMAQLKALGQPATDEVARVAGVIDSWSQQDYTAWLTSLDQTDPGLAAAVRSITTMTGGDYKAGIQALNATGQGIGFARADLQNIPNELVDIITKYAGLPAPPVLSPIQQAIQLFYTGGKPAGEPVGTGTVLRGGSANGSVWDGKSSPFAGLFPMQQVKAFANGGIENHNANIYKPTSKVPFRIFAEAETQGESYIPHSAAKRQRSLQIWKETGRILGVDMTAYANGGMTGNSGRSTSGALTVNIDQMVNHSDASPDDFARSLFRKVRAAGAYSPVEVI